MDVSGSKNYYEGDPYALTPMKVIRKLILRNNKFLFVVIANIISLISCAIVVFSLKLGFGTVISQFIELIASKLDPETAEVLMNIQQAVGVINSVFLGVALLSLLPPILLAVGCLLVYMGVKKNNPSMVCNGSLLFRILFTYYSVICALGIAAVVFSVTGVFMNMAEAAPFAVIVGIVLIIPLIVADTYFSKFANMFASLTLSVKTGINVMKVYSFVTVINWIFAIFGMITSVASIASNFFTGIGGVLSSLALIFVTMLFSEYKEEMGDPSKEDIQAAKKLK